MANETYTLIQKTTVGSGGAASITFSSIPQTFTDLVVRLSARGGQANVNQSTSISLNGSSSNFTGKRLYGTGSAAGTDSALQLESNGASATASVFSNEEIYIPNYTSSNAKAISVDGVTENNATLAYVFLQAGLWNPAVQAAITSVTLTAVSSSFAQYTTASLYGVAKQGVNPVAGPKAIGGDIITNDGTYWIHQFLNSGTFTPSQSLTADYLVVAGGASGGVGGVGGGGGGAGGMRCTVGGTGGSGSLEAPLSLTAQSYTVTVGAGGAGTNSLGNNGSNSVFATITSTGGGGGSNGGSSGVAGNAGGSGGGGAGRAAPVNGGAASPSGQGFAGGNGTGVAGTDGAGGGGGASAVGANGSHPNGGAGGNGRATSISGSSVTYAGGGGGGTGGTSGGAAGSGGGGIGGDGSIPSGSAGTVNTGGGSGGSRGTANTQNGGSGIVIIRYAI